MLVVVASAHDERTPGLDPDHRIDAGTGLVAGGSRACRSVHGVLLLRANRRPDRGPLRLPMVPKLLPQGSSIP
jgi:hypothetical protein